MRQPLAGWQQARLGDVIQIKHGYAFRSEYFASDGPYIVATPGNFRDEGGFKFDEGKAKRYRGPIPDGYVLSHGALLVAMTEQAEGLLGSAAFIPKDNLFLHNQRLGEVRITAPQKIEKRFLYYIFNSPDVRFQIRASASGTKVRHTSPTRICDSGVRLPPLDVQCRISGILGAFDDFIDNNTRRIAILEEMARRIFEEWFVHFDVPGYETRRKIKSSIGPIPEGWHVVRGEELFELNPEQILPHHAPEVIRYIDIASVSPGTIDTITTTPFAEAPSRARRVVRHGDTIWSCVRPNRRSFALIVHPDEDTIVSTGFAVLRPRELPFAFIYLLTTTNEFAAYLTNHTTGAAYPAVKAEDFGRAEFVMPPAQAVSKFSEIAEPMLLLMHNLHRQNRNLRAQRDLLLPKLISGEIDVSAAERVMEAAE